MMEENNIFLAGGDTLVYLAVPLYKKYFTTFVWGHPFSTTYLRTSFSTPHPHSLPRKHMFTFRVTATTVGLFKKILTNTPF